MALPVSYFGMTYNDNTLKGNGIPESTSFRVPTTTITAANIVAQEAFITSFVAATNAITIGQEAKQTVTARDTLVSTSPAASPLAQRENKWLCRYHDVTTQQKFTISIGTADLSLLANNSEFLDITQDEGLDFKLAFDDLVKSPSDPTHGVSLDSVQFVGRST